MYIFRISYSRTMLAKFIKQSSLSLLLLLPREYAEATGAVVAAARKDAPQKKTELNLKA